MIHKTKDNNNNKNTKHKEQTKKTKKHYLVKIMFY